MISPAGVGRSEGGVSTHSSVSSSIGAAEVLIALFRGFQQVVYPESPYLQGLHFQTLNNFLVLIYLFFVCCYVRSNFEKAILSGGITVQESLSPFLITFMQLFGFVFKFGLYTISRRVKEKWSRILIGQQVQLLQ